MTRPNDGWCMWFQGECAEKGSHAAGARALKQRLVQAGGAHAALVYDGDVAVGWCEYGAPAGVAEHLSP